MRDTATIYWDRVEGCHHVIMCGVEESGDHRVRQSSIHNNAGTNLDRVMKYWEEVVGGENVRAYNITQYAGKDMCRYSFTR